MTRTGSETCPIGVFVGLLCQAVTVSFMDALTILIFIAGAIVTLDAASRIASSILGRSIASGLIARRRLRQLGANCQVDYFNTILGPPTVRQALESGAVEHIWIDRYYFAQAVVDAHGTITVYSVTTRRRWFRVEVPFPNDGRYTLGGARVQARLGKTAFDAVGAEPETLTADIGARRWWYTEVFYFGNPGNYQSVALSLNQAGHEVSSAWEELEAAIRGGQGQGAVQTLRAKDLPTFRRASKPNTYTVSAPHFPLAQRPASSAYFGVDVDTVRVLPK